MNNKHCNQNYPLIWITKSSCGGDVNSRIGIAEHIGGNYHELQLPLDFCTPQQIKDRLVNSGHLDEKEEWPDILIGADYHISYMQEIKRLSGGKTMVVAMRRPVRDLPINGTEEELNASDLIVSYEYHNNDNIPNLLVCSTLPNRVTSGHLNEDRVAWEARFSQFTDKGPTIGLIVGGSIGNRKIFSNDIAVDLGAKVNKIAEGLGASVLISMSARTPEECKGIICSKIKVPSYIYDPINTVGENPYFGILGSSDYLIVTADSMSMCCESSASGKPVYIYSDESIVEAKHMKMVSNLVDIGCARILDDSGVIEKFSYTPVNSAKDIAERVREVLSKRKGSGN